MKWLHNLSARQRRRSTRSIPIHTLFVGRNGSNEIWSAEESRYNIATQRPLWEIKVGELNSLVLLRHGPHRKAHRSRESERGRERELREKETSGRMKTYLTKKEDEERNCERNPAGKISIEKQQNQHQQQNPTCAGPAYVGFCCWFWCWSMLIFSRETKTVRDEID